MEKFDILSIEAELQKDDERAGFIENAFKNKANILNRVKTILSDDLSDEEKSCLISTLYEPKLKEAEKKLSAVLLESIDTDGKAVLVYNGDREVGHGETSSSHKVTNPSSVSATTGANNKDAVTTSAGNSTKVEKKTKEETVSVDVKVEDKKDDDTLPF